MTVDTSKIKSGNIPKQWDWLGTVVELHCHGSYTVKVDSTSHLKRRNSRYLRGFESTSVKITNWDAFIGPALSTLLRKRLKAHTLNVTIFQCYKRNSYYQLHQRPYHVLRCSPESISSSPPMVVTQPNTTFPSRLCSTQFASRSIAVSGSVPFKTVLIRRTLLDRVALIRHHGNTCQKQDSGKEFWLCKNW